MLTSEAASTIIAIATGAVKITRRIDQILAEKEAVQQPIAMPVPNVALGPTPNQMKSGLTKLLAQPFSKGADPLGSDRTKIENLLAGNPTGPLMFPFVKEYLPTLAIQRTLNLNGAFVTAIKQSRPGWADDPDLLTTAFYVGAGADFRSQSYTWRLAMAVVEVLAEFGVENTALFTRDKRVQAVAGAVLQRFASSDLSEIDSTSSLLRTVLKSTLNGVLDSKKSLGIDNVWVNALLDAVVTARASVADPDNFVIGLFQGRGYPQLVAGLMDQASAVFAADQANAFKQTAATFLTDIGAILKTQPSFKSFFNDHWGDIVQAGLASVAQHGPQLLGGKSPLLGKVLSAVAGTLSQQPASKLLSKQTLIAIVVHHNVIWNCREKGIVTKGDRNRIYHNTCFDNPKIDILVPRNRLPGKTRELIEQNKNSEVYNNIGLVTGSWSWEKPKMPPFAKTGRNLDAGADNLRDPAKLDFRLKKGAAAIDAVGPDLGAHEFGGTDWKAGYQGKRQ